MAKRKPDCTTKPSGFWKKRENLDALLDPIIEELGRFPTHTELIRRDLNKVNTALVKYYGGHAQYAREKGVSYTPRTKKGHWKDLNNVLEILNPIIEELGRFPLERELRERDLHSVAHAIGRYHGGITKLSRELGYGKVRERNGHWTDIERIHEKIDELVEELGKFPSRKDLIDRGLSGLYQAIYAYHGGLKKYSGERGYEYNERKKAHFWKDFENIQDSLTPIIEELGRFPKQRELSKRGLHGLLIGINKYHNGLNSVRQKLGYPSTRRPSGYWDSIDHINQAVSDLYQQLGEFPRCVELRSNGLSGAIDSIRKKFGSLAEYRSYFLEEVHQPQDSKVEELLDEYLRVDKKDELESLIDNYLS